MARFSHISTAVLKGFWSCKWQRNNRIQQWDRRGTTYIWQWCGWCKDVSPETLLCSITQAMAPSNGTMLVKSRMVTMKQFAPLTLKHRAWSLTMKSMTQLWSPCHMGSGSMPSSTPVIVALYLICPMFVDSTGLKTTCLISVQFLGDSWTVLLCLWSPKPCSFLHVWHYLLFPRWLYCSEHF